MCGLKYREQYIRYVNTWSRLEGLLYRYRHALVFVHDHVVEDKLGCTHINKGINN